MARKMCREGTLNATDDGEMIYVKPGRRLGGPFYQREAVCHVIGSSVSPPSHGKLMYGG